MGFEVGALFVNMDFHLAQLDQVCRVSGQKFCFLSRQTQYSADEFTAELKSVYGIMLIFPMTNQKFIHVMYVFNARKLSYVQGVVQMFQSTVMGVVGRCMITGSHTNV